jgi:hypothetical protein
MTSALPRLRLRLKRAVANYYLDLCSHGVASPSEAYESCIDYLYERKGRLGPDLFQSELDEERTRLAAEIEQDLRLSRGWRADIWAQESLEARLEECFSAALKRLPA